MKAPQYRRDHRTCGISRRTVLRAGGAAALAAAGLGPWAGREALAQTDTLTIMTVGGSWGDSIRELIAEPFARQHDLRLAWDNRPNAQQIAAIQAMRGNPSVDTAEMGGPRLGHAISLGLLDPIDPKKAPNFARIHPNFKNDYWAARNVAPWVLTFNTKFVSKEEAEEKGWELLADPRFRGRVAVPRFGWMGEMWLHAVNLAAGGGYDDIDYAIDLSRRAVRDNNGLEMASNDQGMTMLTSEEIVVAPFWTGRTYELADKGVPLDFVYAPGWTFYGFGFVLLRGGPRQELVTQFIDWSLSPEVQLEVATRFAYLPTLADFEVPDDPPRLQVSQAELDRAANLDYSEVTKHSDQNLERWNKEVLG
jgi:putative spermidine/putrescine transport system substrate-binding protein